jgi:hypothetical protein
MGWSRSGGRGGSRRARGSRDADLSSRVDVEACWGRDHSLQQSQLACVRSSPVVLQKATSVTRVRIETPEEVVGAAQLNQRSKGVHPSLIASRIDTSPFTNEHRIASGSRNEAPMVGPDGRHVAWEVAGTKVRLRIHAGTIHVRREDKLLGIGE